MEHTGYKKRTFRGSPLRLYHHDNHTGYTTETTTSWLQTNQNSTSDYNRVFKLVWQIKMLKVVHGNQCNKSDTQPSIPLLYIIQYYSSTRKHPKLSHPCLACTLWLCCTLKLLLLFLGTSQTKSQPTVWPIADFLLIYMLILTIILPVNANPDYITIIMPANQ